jgi:hypothetical protein
MKEEDLEGEGGRYIQRRAMRWMLRGGGVEHAEA